MKLRAKYRSLHVVSCLIRVIIVAAILIVSGLILVKGWIEEKKGD